MKYRSLTKAETKEVYKQIEKVLKDKSLPFSGKHRKEQWEKGWGENQKSGNLTPKYFGKYKVNRRNGKFVLGLTKNYEQEMLYTIVDKLAKKYLSKADYIAEFGCGTGHNLLRVRKVNKNAGLMGFDWAKSSQKIVNKLGKGIIGENFDFFSPAKWMLPDNTAVYTVAALEQTGTRYKKFVEYLLINNPSIVVHIEPIPELLNRRKYVDNLSIRYMKKRKYLSGYLAYLRSLEKKGKIKILEAKRSGVGSMFIDGYSVIVWRPI